jgi:hypothetical protein
LPVLKLFSFHLLPPLIVLPQLLFVVAQVITFDLQHLFQSFFFLFQMPFQPLPQVPQCCFLLLLSVRLLHPLPFVPLPVER